MRLRVAKWVGALVAGAIVLVLLAIGIVTLCVDPNRYRRSIEVIVGDMAGKPLQIHGDLRFSWLPPVGVQIGSAALGPPTSPIIEWQSARVGVRLLPLMRGRVIVDEIHLDAPRIHLLRDGQGHGNWEGIPARHPTATQSAMRGSALEIGATEIENGQLDYLDEAGGAHWTISHWKLRAGAWQEGRPVSVTTQFQLQSDPTVPNALPVEIDVRDLAMSQSPLTIKVPHLTIRFSDAQLEGDLTAEIPDATADPTARPVAVSKVPRIAVARGTLALRVPSVRNLVSQLQLVERLPQDPETLGLLQSTGDWSFAGGVLKLQPLDVQLDATRFHGWVERSSIDSAWKFELQGDRIDLKRYMDLQKPQHEEPFVLPVDKLRALRADGALVLDEAQLADAELKGVRMRVTSSP